MNLLFNDKELLKKYNEIWDKISNLLKRGFDREQVYDNKLKIKIKIYDKRININFYGYKKLEDIEYCTCLSVIILDSAVKINNDYYPKIFLEECRYPVTRKR